MAEDKKIKVPDIGGATGVDVIEILVKVGDTISEDTPLVTLESDKASMEIPSPMAGVVKSLLIRLGDKLSEGDDILTLESSASDVKEAPPKEESKKEPAPLEIVKEEPIIEKAVLKAEESPSTNERHLVADDQSSEHIFAGPAVRRLARELGVSLAAVSGTGRKDRISKDDVLKFVKTKMSEKSSAGSFALPSAPVIDFTKFGEIDLKPLNKIKRLTATNLHNSWLTIPHVTQFDEADITLLEDFRKSEISNSKATDYKLTILAFVCKIVANALKVYPQFNSSLDATGENLIHKHYYNIGIAVETPNGLVVPVIKNVNLLSVGEIAKEMARLSLKAREKGLMPQDMNGGSFTISSLGGIGGTAFTPIVNSPEVAILGLSRSSIKPVYINGEFKPRLMLPLSLSYDHRVIDGAEAARFTRYICDCLSDLRRILL